VESIYFAVPCNLSRAIGDAPPYVAIKASVVTTFLDSNSIQLPKRSIRRRSLAASPKMPGASRCQWNAAVSTKNTLG
jgi:hypothetical protein